MDSREIVKMYNDDGMSLAEIAKKIGSSKSTVSRTLAKDKWVYNKSIKKYILETDNTGNNETINNEIIEKSKNVSRETNKTVNCTFALPMQLHRELKAKCALSGVKMVDFVREVLENSMKNK